MSWLNYYYRLKNDVNPTVTTYFATLIVALPTSHTKISNHDFLSCFQQLPAALQQKP